MPTKVSNNTKFPVTFYTDDMSDSVTIPAGSTVSIADCFKAKPSLNVSVTYDTPPEKIHIATNNTSFEKADPEE